MEHNEKMVLIAAACVEINYIHDSISLLKQIECTFILLSFDKLICGVVELRHHNRDLVFTHS